MSEEPGGRGPSFEERMRVARNRQGLDNPPRGPEADRDDRTSGMSPWGDRHAGGRGAGLRAGRGGCHRVGAGPVARHPAYLSRLVRAVGGGGWDPQRLAHVRAATPGLTGRGGKVAAGSSTIDALGQFRLETVLGGLGAALDFTQSNVMMVVGGVLVIGMLWVGMRPKALVPGRAQALAELAYTGVMSMCVESIGPEGRKFFPVHLHPIRLRAARQPARRVPLVLHLYQPHRRHPGAGAVRRRPHDVCRTAHPRSALLQLLRAPGRAEAAAGRCWCPSRYCPTSRGSFRFPSACSPT